LLWLIFLIGVRYSGHASGLFYTGRGVALPPELNAHTFRVADPVGYDGQYYHMLAHDPWNQRGFVAFMDNPSLRWRRIGVPALAWLLAGGYDAWIDWTYLAVEFGFLLLGAWWAGRYSALLLTIPAVLVSLDRMTIDLPLAVLSLGLLRFAESRYVFAILCAAPLIRETGILLVAGWVLWRLLGRRWKDALAGAACGIPALAWWLWVSAHTPADRTAWLAPWPFSGLLGYTLSIPAPGQISAAFVTEMLALCGFWIALALPFWLLAKRRGLPELTAAMFLLFFSMFGRQDIWDSAYATGRTLSPLLILLGWIALRDRFWIAAAPVLLILPRIALQYIAELRLL
jgi:hypothetical protein